MPNVSDTIMIRKTRNDFLNGNAIERDADIFDAILTTNQNVASLLEYSQEQQEEIDEVSIKQTKLESTFARIIGYTASVSVLIGIVITILIK